MRKDAEISICILKSEMKRKGDRNTYQINSFWSVSGNMFSIKSI